MPVAKGDIVDGIGHAMTAQLGEPPVAGLDGGVQGAAVEGVIAGGVRDGEGEFPGDAGQLLKGAADLLMVDGKGVSDGVLSDPQRLVDYLQRSGR